MAGIARPSNNILIGSKKEMTEYEILNFSSYNNTLCNCNPNNLFDEKIDKWPYSFDWNYNGDYMQIKINKPCNIYIRLAINGLGQNSALDIQPTTYKQQNTLQAINEWQLWVTKLQPGIYIFSHLSGYRDDTEWFFEEIITESQMIKNKIKNTILNNELFKKYCIPIEEE